MGKEASKLIANNKKAYFDYFIEETYEVIEAIDTEDTQLLKEELGDFGNNITIIPFSALKGTGADDVRKTIEKAIEEN